VVFLINRILSNLKFLKIQTEINDNLNDIVEERVEFSQKALYETKTNEHLVAIGIKGESKLLKRE